MNNIAWIDIETTGLRPYKDAILEIGIIVTCPKLAVIAEQNWVIYPSQTVGLHEVDPYVLNMHTNNGLWMESFASKLKLHDAAAQAAAFIDEHGALRSPACGSTVHFDRSVIKAQAPVLNDAFHYRNIDVSTVKNLVKMFQPDDVLPPLGDNKVHRALDDLHASIDELRHYARAFGWDIAGA